VPPVPNTIADGLFQADRVIACSIRRSPTRSRAGAGRLQPPAEIHPAVDADRLRQGRMSSALRWYRRSGAVISPAPTDSGKPIVFNDASADRLHAAALKAKDDPQAFPALRRHLRRCCAINAVPQTVRACAARLWEKGTRATLQLYLDGKLGVMTSWMRFLPPGTRCGAVHAPQTRARLGLPWLNADPPAGDFRLRRGSGR
jgi:mannitol 2-dehydrogenase